MFLSKGINVVSLFDGKSSGKTACDLSGIGVDKYYAAEIDKYATQVSNALYPSIIRLGDVTKWREWNIDWSSIDLLLGGFPYQAWSMAGKQQGDKDERGMLFWTMLDIFKHVQQLNPSVKFLIENVKMKKEFEKYITHHTEQALGHVEKHLINSALVSAQNRQRYYWCNWDVPQPDDLNIMLQSVLETGLVDRDKSYALTARYFKAGNLNRYATKASDQLIFECFGLSETCVAKFRRLGVKFITHDRLKSKVLTAGDYVKLGKYSNYLRSLSDKNKARKLTPRECFRLQTVPEHLINKILDSGVSNTQLYKIAGNGWTDEVIAHILRHSGLVQ